ncbi:MAG: hypothetical protein V4719_00995 [Planctomycetota bacterium]
MANYVTVHLVRKIPATEIVLTDDIQYAIRLAAEKYQATEFFPASVDGKTILGQCRGCDVYVIGKDVHSRTAEGLFCARCSTPKIKP